MQATATRLGTAHAVPATISLPVSMHQHPGARVLLANVPYEPATTSLIGMTPQIQELVSEAMPTIWHCLERESVAMVWPVLLFFVNPRASAMQNANCWAQVMQSIGGHPHVLVPVSSSHSMIVSMLKEWADWPSPACTEHALLYVGDAANKNTLQQICTQSQMTFFFHALY